LINPNQIGLLEESILEAIQMKRATLAGVVGASACLAISGWFVACSSFSTIGPITEPSKPNTSENKLPPLHLGLVAADASKEGSHKTNAGDKGKPGQKQTTSAIEVTRMNGFLYYLPKGRIRISGDFGSAQTSSTTKSATTTSPSQSTGSSASPKSMLASDTSTDDSSQPKNFVVTIAADIEADPKARYYIKPDRNYFYDDDIHLTVNAKHLLSTGNATATDETAQIIATSVQLAAQLPLVKSFAQPSWPRLLTIQTLLDLIDDQVWHGKVAPDTSLSGPDPSKLHDALRGPIGALGTSDKKMQVEARLASFSPSKSVTLLDVRSLLELFLPEAKDQVIDTSKTTDFFNSLWNALNPPTSAKKKAVKPFSVVFDPDNPPHGMTDTLDSCGFTVTAKKLPQPELKVLKSIWSGQTPTAHGIVFRSVRPYRVTVDSHSDAFYIHEERLILLPDTTCGHELVLDYSRVPFVKKVTNMVFVDGVPQDLTETVPSPVLGFLSIPKAIIEALVPNPLKSAPTTAKQGNAP
jgi:hypothetical protein